MGECEGQTCVGRVRPSVTFGNHPGSSVQSSEPTVPKGVRRGHLISHDTIPTQQHKPPRLLKVQTTETDKRCQDERDTGLFDQK